MLLKKIKVANFKSFDEAEVELGKFNVLIGANASGKSNFVRIFRFLRDIKRHGVNDAVFLQGGNDYFTNINIGLDKDFLFKIALDDVIDEDIVFITYDLEIKFGKESFNIIEDTVNIVNVKGEPVIPPPLKYFVTEDEITYKFVQKNFAIKGLTEIAEDLAYLPIYDFDPKLSKQAIPLEGKAQLEDNGSNLPIILRNILKNEEKRRMLLNLVSYLLPFVDDLKVEPFFTGQHLLLTLKEKYFEEYLPANLLSDGTINVIALIVALYFEEKPLIIIEEPETHIHPSLMGRVIKMMKEASQQKQIIVTTHNPELVKYAGVENLLLISKDKEGFSRISKPAEKEHVKIFLENEIGIDKLYVKDLLGGN